MKRYHKKIYFPSEYELFNFNNELNSISWKYSSHSLERIKENMVYTELEKLLKYVSCLNLNQEDIFEYYADDDGYIIKACYRVSYSDYNDLILVVGCDKKLITVYFNNINDNHITLNKSLYIQRG